MRSGPRLVVTGTGTAGGTAPTCDRLHRPTGPTRSAESGPRPSPSTAGGHSDGPAPLRQ